MGRHMRREILRKIIVKGRDIISNIDSIKVVNVLILRLSLSRLVICKTFSATRGIRNHKFHSGG
jgi:hypothetical protein